MENLLKDLLWLSRIESDQREGEKELVNIGALLGELRDEISGTNPGRALELEIETGHRVYGDYRELYSAASNLVNNAIKYSPEDGLVKVRWRQQGDSCLLTVRDWGMGIDPVHFSRLTERFYRVDDSRSSATGGTGIGLAIVKHVAMAHGAQLQIDSQLGEGSTFTLVFPVRD
jgi:two-component system phosphate regulon sensor histidine kinase PhoR